MNYVLIIGGLGIAVVCFWVGWKIAQVKDEVKMTYANIEKSHKINLEIIKLVGDFVREVLEKARRS